MGSFTYVENKCFLCGSGAYRVLYRQNFSPDILSEYTFSPKSIRKNYHFQFVRCRECGLAYSTPILERDVIEDLYRKSKFLYLSEVQNINESYARYLEKVEDGLPTRQRILELGCGNGAFLQVALQRGFQEVFGVEPSKEAVDNGPEGIKHRITNDVFRPGDFKEDFFDLVCFFQVLDHAIDPNEFLQGVYRCLKPGGTALALTHDIGSYSARILGEKCNIIDINHALLFDKQTLGKFFEKHGFRVVEIFDVANVYSLGFWVQILNLPKVVTRGLLAGLSMLGMKEKRLRIRAGNIGIVAKK